MVQNQVLSPGQPYNLDVSRYEIISYNNENVTFTLFYRSGKTSQTFIIPGGTIQEIDGRIYKSILVVSGALVIQEGLFDRLSVSSLSLAGFELALNLTPMHFSDTIQRLLERIAPRSEPAVTNPLLNESVASATAETTIDIYTKAPAIDNGAVLEIELSIGLAAGTAPGSCYMRVRDGSPTPIVFAFCNFASDPVVLKTSRYANLANGTLYLDYANGDSVAHWMTANVRIISA